MSQLSNKITSYTHERGFELDSTLPATNIAPPYTGTNTGTSGWTRTSVGLTYESTVGPVGGSGSWKFDWSNVSGGNGRISLPSISTATSHIFGAHDGDFSIGFWMKFSEVPFNPAGFLFSLGNSSANGVTIQYIGTSNASALRRNKITMQTAGGLATTYSSTGITDTDWHYIAVRRTTSPSIVYYLYLDGVQVATATGTSVTPSTSFTMGSASLQTTAFTINYSNIYFATSSQIGPTEIQEIWLAGSTAPVLNKLKYWNGTAWTNPLSITQWDGTSWTTFNGKVWTGSAWEAIT